MAVAVRACSVDECDRPAKARGWCGTHHERWRSTGTVELAERSPRLCSVAGCERPHLALGFCKTHRYRYLRTGSPGAVEIPPRNALAGTVGYWGAHERVYRARGAARARRCAHECGDQAEHWAYDHQDPAERTEVVRGGWSAEPRAVTYPQDPARYLPLCRACHIRFDRHDDQRRAG